MTLDLFSDHRTGSHQSQQLSIPDGDVVLFPQLFSRAEADYFLRDLTEHMAWKQERIRLYGKEHDIPRLTAWYGDPGKTYVYSGIRVDATPWTETLLTIKGKIEAASGEIFNSVLLNFYRNGSDSVSWHSDDEPELGNTPIIGSVSFGEERPFQLKHKHNKLLKRTILLPHGSLLIMRGKTQSHWLHQIPKSSKELQPRINLTFRTVR